MAKTVDIDTVEFSINKCLGLDNKGNIHPGGLIQRLALNKEKFEYLKKYCSTEMNNGRSWVDMWRNVDMKFIEIEETESFEPIRIFIQDINTVEHRITKLAEAQKLGLSYFCYSGGLHTDSRDFCVHNNGRIFHLKEIKDWALQPLVKDIPFYTPILDFGGRGCHHYPSFISDIAAIKQKDEYDKQADEREKLHKSKYHI